MTPKQYAFIVKLSRERDYPIAGQSPEEAMIIARHEDALGGVNSVSTVEASRVIDWLLSQPRLVTPNSPSDWKLVPGVYVLPDGRVVQGKSNKAGTNVYSLLWVETNADRLNDEGEHVRGEWQYAPELKALVRPEHKMTLEQARTFTLRYGQCARCCRKLKAAQSVEEGIGPVCRKYFSLV
jgi:hypothetical protein